MAVQIKSLYVGELTLTTDATVYIAPDTAAAIVKTVRFVNKSASIAKLTVTFRKWVTGTTYTEQPMLPLKVEVPPSQMLVADDELTMSAKDQIVAKLETGLSSGAGVAFVVSGVERDI